jgi:hypothetical protein
MHSPLWAEQADRSFPEFSQPVVYQFSVFQWVLHQDMRRDYRRITVVLLDELAQYQAWGVVLSPFHEKMVSADEFVMPDEENFYPRLVGALGHR